MMRFTDLKREAGFVFGHRQIKLTSLVVFRTRTRISNQILLVFKL